MRMLIAAVVFWALFPGFTRAHEGEQHAGPEVAAVPAPGEGLQVESAFSETFELVVKHPPLFPRQEETWRIFLTDYQTNAPVEKARIGLSARGPGEINVDAAETDVHGIYEAKLSLPQKGDYTLTVEIEVGELTDAFIINGVSVGVQGPAPWRKRARVLKQVLAVGGLLAVGLLLWRKRRVLAGFRKGAGKVAVLLLALALRARSAQAHGGEDHGGSEAPTSAVPATGSAIALSKESQFLLGIRTETVASRELRRRISTLGNVVPRSQGRAEVVSLQSGRLINDEHYKIPQIGDRIEKGDIVAEIEVIDSFHIKAPISGVVTEVNFTSGEWIEQGKKLLSIVELSTVWVEASVFESDLPAMEGARQSFIRSSTYPEKEFKGALVSLGKVLDPNTRSVKAVFAVDNPRENLRPGMLVDVSIETKSLEESLAVPASAVLDKDGQRVVFVKTGPETFVMRPVDLGGQYGVLVAVKSGLAEGDRVVITGNYQLLTTPPSAVRPK